MTLAGEALQVGQAAPDFTLHRFKDGAMQALTLKDFAGKPTIISVVPSLDTGVCQKQTKEFNERVGAMGDKVNAVTVSLDLPFAQNRFCGAENITNMVTLSDYQDRRFGQDYGMLIEELKILARGVVVVDGHGKVAYSELVPEVTQEPNYDAALAAVAQLG
jgi:thiol peroxidase